MCAEIVWWASGIKFRKQWLGALSQGNPPQPSSSAIPSLAAPAVSITSPSLVTCADTRCCTSGVGVRSMYTTKASVPGRLIFELT